MHQRRTFDGKFKAQIALELVMGKRTAAEICREHRLSPELVSRWKSELIERAANLFEEEVGQQQARLRIAELERLVGQLTLELEISKKASLMLPWSRSR